jgi:hypothetical protein
VLDRVVDCLSIRVGVGDHETIASRAAEGLFVVETPADRLRPSALPSARDVVPAAVERILRAGARDGQGAVDDRHVVNLEEARLAGFEALPREETPRRFPW